MNLDKQIKIIFPESSGTYKFIQVIINDIQALIIAKDIRQYHREILERTLIEHNIHYTKILNHVGIEIPRPTDDKNYTLIGAGKVEINIPEKKAEFFGVSIDYKKEINIENINLAKNQLKDWNLWINHWRR